MPLPTASLALGAPRFGDPHLDQLARDQGQTAAWTRALQLGPRRAAAAARGGFAVAVQTPAGSTFLAVDRLGIHTLCYRLQGGTLRFATRADELADDGHDIDAQAVYDYLYFHTIPSPRTIFKDVQRLPPGHFAWFENGTLKVEPYWVPAFEEDRAPPFDALRDEFRALMRQAVQRQLDGSPPACFLSGGTDSSTVAGLIRDVSGQPPATYSIGFAAEGYDEMAYARIAARHFATDHHEHYVTPDDLMRSIPALAEHVDGPFGNSSLLAAFHCASAARQDGVQRLLAGDGGDELFGGNSRYATQRVLDGYSTVPGAVRRHVLEPLLLNRIAAAVPLVRKASSYVRQARMPLPDRLESYNLLLRMGPARVLTDAFLCRVDPDAPPSQQREVWAHAQAPGVVNRMLAYDWRYTLAENDLPKVRWATEAAGVAAGFPLLDDDLLDFSMRLRSSYKLKGLRLRWFFKEALRGFLPDEIIAKKKHGFGLPFGVWLMSHPALRTLATESLAGLVERGLVRRPFVDELLGPRMREHAGYYGEMVWILTMLEQWLQRHAGRARLRL